MPIIITPPEVAQQPHGSGRATLRLTADSSPVVIQTGRATLELRALTLAGGRATLTLQASSETRRGQATLDLRARTAPERGRARLLLQATSHPTQSGEVRVYVGTRPKRYRMFSRGRRVLSFEYSRTAQGRELTLVLPGEVRVSRGELMLLHVDDLETGGGLQVEIPADGEYTIEQLPAGGARTTIRAADPEYKKLAAYKLGELIPWANNPSREIALPGYRSITRQVRPVADVVREAFQKVGQTLAIFHDPLASQRWEETRREYSTIGKSPLDVFRDTYGALNYELVWMGPDAWRAFGPGEFSNQVKVPRRVLLPSNEQRRALQYPASVRVQVGDVFTQRVGYLHDVATTGSLPDQAAGPDGKPIKIEIRDPQAAGFEVDDDAVLTGKSAADDGTTIAYYIQKSGGRVVRSIDVTVGDLMVAHELASNPGELARRRLFRGVVLAYSETVNTYLGPLSTTVASTRTTSRRYAYGFDTKLTAAGLPVEIDLTGAKVGALLWAERTSEVYVYSHSGGFLRSKTRSEEKITAVGQENADSVDPAHPPGPPVALESNRTATVETWAPVGGGLWRHSQTRSHPAKLPVRDLASADWVKQIHSPSVSVSTEITDNAPPAVSDPNIPAPEAQGGALPSAAAPMFPIPPAFQYLRDPQIIRVDLGGLGDPAEISLPFVEDNQGQLTREYGKQWAHELRPRIDRTLSSYTALALTPRMYVYGFGLVRSVQISGRAGALTLGAQCELRLEQVE